MTRLLIAAPSPVLRAGLESLAMGLAGIKVAGSFADLSAVDDLRPDVVLAALSPESIPPPVERNPPAYVLIAGGPGAIWTHEAVRAGVRAILPPETAPAGIVAAIEAAASGLAAIDPRELASLVDTALPQQPASGASALTGRERQVLSLLAEGAGNKTIAWKLNISENTVKFHVASILAKLNAGSRTEAVTIGIRKGLVML